MFYGKGLKDAERKMILRDFSIQYIYWGPLEQALGNFDPRQEKYLSKIYDRDGVLIFRVGKL
jgi:uncharacterized membrane protein